MMGARSRIDPTHWIRSRPVQVLGERVLRGDGDSETGSHSTVKFRWLDTGHTEEMGKQRFYEVTHE